MKTRRLSLQSLEARDVPAANLAVENIQIKFADAITVPGDVGFVKFTIQNNGDERSDPGGLTGMHVYLSDTGNPFDQDAFLGKLPNKNLAIDPGAGRTFKVLLRLPGFSFPFPEAPEGTYHLVVTSPPGVFPPAASPGTFEHRHWFGEVGDRKGVELEYSSGGLQFSIKDGPGTGKFVPSGNEMDLVLENTDEKSTVVAAGRLSLPLRNITAASAVGSIVMTSVNVTGNVSLPGGAKGVVFDQLGDGIGHSTLSIGAGDDKPVTLGFNRLRDATVDVDAPIAVFVAEEWLDVEGTADLLTAPSLRVLRIAPGRQGLSGDFQADVTISGTPFNKKKDVIGDVKVGGTVRGSIWTVQGGAATRTAKVLFYKDAEEFRFLSEGHVESIVVRGNFVNTAATPGDALAALTFEEIELKGEVEVDLIIAHGSVAEKDEAINRLTVGVAKRLGVEAKQGGIAGLTAVHWPSRRLVETEWINQLGLRPNKLFDPFTTYEFSPNLTVTGVKPGTTLSLSKANLPNGEIGGTAPGDRAVWNIEKGIGLVDAYRIEHLQIDAESLAKMRVGTSVFQSQVGVTQNIELVEVGSVEDSTFSAVDIVNFKQTGSAGFTGTVTASGTLFNLRLTNVGAMGSPFGIRTSRLLAYKRFDGANKANAEDQLTAPGTYDVLGNFSVVIN